MDQSTDIEVVSTVVGWLEQGGVAMLATVVNTWGSAPRRPGALMAIHMDGRVVGSVSGGCIEDDLVQRSLRGEFENAAPQLLEYGISTATTQRVGLPCGGKLQILVEYIKDITPMHELLDSMQQGQRIARHVHLDSGKVSLRAINGDQDLVLDGRQLIKWFGPAWRMLIIGAGELARRVAQLALTLDYSVTVCDPRPEYASGWEVPGTEFSSNRPEQCLDNFGPDQHSIILTLAHAPQLEDQALAAALNTDAFYIGALGSRNNHARRLQRLQQLGLNATQLDRLHGPVGLDIGSHTPAEIAIAIIADLIKMRNQRVLQPSASEAVHG